MKTINPNLLVNMDHVIGDLVYEYGIPYLYFSDLIKLGQHTVRVYGLDKSAKRISFDVLCTYISMFIKTPFGNRVLRNLAKV